MIDSLHGGVQGIANIMENVRVEHPQPHMNQQEQQHLGRTPEQGETGAKLQTAGAVQGLGENINLTV